MAIHIHIKLVTKHFTTAHTKITLHIPTNKSMKPIDDKQEKVTFRAVSRDEEGKKRVEKVEVSTHNIDTIKFIDRKLKDKGIQRMDRHPVDGYTGGIGRPPPKSGHGGKYTWEGPKDTADNELEAAPAAIDEKDPNYVDEEGEERVVRGEDSDLGGYVVGEVEVAKVEEEGVGRIEVDPRLEV